MLITLFLIKLFYPIKESFTREQLKLPKDKILFCNHAGAARLDPIALDYWSQILKKVNNSALVLKNFPERTENMKNEFRKRGLYVSDDNEDPLNTLYFMGGGSQSDHIPQKSTCNVYLDLHWYNGHSTTGDMFWAGVPLITYPSQSMAGRAAASFSIAAGFPEMVVNSWEEYVDRAVSLVSDPARYKGLRKRVEDSRMVCPLFDIEGWVKNLERGYKEMMSIYKSGGHPRNIVVNELI